MPHAVATAIEVEQLAGPAFTIAVGAHRLVVDQPEVAGGHDRGPTPTELFVASLASCTAHYAYSYLHHHGLPDTGIEVRCSYEWESASPPRVAAVDLQLVLPEGIPEERVPAVIRAASRCAVHSSITHGLAVEVHA